MEESTEIISGKVFTFDLGHVQLFFSLLFLCITTSGGGAQSKQTTQNTSSRGGINSEASPPKSNPSPPTHPHLDERKHVCRWHVFDVHNKKEKGVSVYSVEGADWSHHSAPPGGGDCRSPLRPPVTCVDLAEESWFPLEVVLSSLIPFVSSFHSCCNSAGLKPPKTWRNEGNVVRWRAISSVHVCNIVICASLSRRSVERGGQRSVSL